MDSSWFIDWNGFRMIIDPWLIGSEIDGGKWLNEQSHTTAPVSVDKIPQADCIIITQSYSDHCHLQTLAALDHTLPIYATGKAFRILTKKLTGRNINLINESGFDSLKVNHEFELLSMRPAKIVDPVYFSLVIKHKEKVIFISPHGFTFSGKQLGLIKILDFKLIITTFSSFKLPSIMGGHVNPGMENVNYLIQTLKPAYVINSHDEKKIMKGLVNKFAKVSYPDISKISFTDANFIPTPDYSEIMID